MLLSRERVMPRTAEPSGKTAGAAVEPLAPARATRGVLVPLDGTQLAEEALAIGASLAHRAGAPLHLVSAVVPVLEVVRREFPELAEREVQDETAERKAYLERLAEMISAIRPGVVQASVLSGDPGEAIASYAAREGVDFIVLATHGRGRVARWCLGSVADTLLQRSETPLLLLHVSETPHLGEYRRIVVGLEGEHDRQVLDAARRLGSLSPDTRFVLAGVVEPAVPLLTPLALYPQHAGPRWRAGRIADAEARLRALARELEAQGERVTWEVIGRRDVARALGKIGRSAGADCLVVGTHGLSGVDRALLGSVAAKLLRETSLPLLVVPLKLKNPSAPLQGPLSTAG
jgi:nucleotide-binding universal stress UspA family protein